jgi:hypothetical protein
MLEFLIVVNIVGDLTGVGPIQRYGNSQAATRVIANGSIVFSNVDGIERHVTVDPFNRGGSGAGLNRGCCAPSRVA